MPGPAHCLWAAVHRPPLSLVCTRWVGDLGDPAGLAFSFPVAHALDLECSLPRHHWGHLSLPLPPFLSQTELSK